MSVADGLSARELNADDSPALQAFDCLQQNRWTKDVQRTIRADVVDLVEGALDDDAVAVPIGWFDGAELVGVAVYAATQHFEILCLAVAAEAQGQHIGFQMKRHLIEMASDLGFVQVFSRVHRANHPMLSINYRLGAWVEVEEEDRNFHICVVNVS